MNDQHDAAIGELILRVYEDNDALLQVDAIVGLCDVLARDASSLADRTDAPPTLSADGPTDDVPILAAGALPRIRPAATSAGRTPAGRSPRHRVRAIAVGLSVAAGLAVASFATAGSIGDIGPVTAGPARDGDVSADGTGAADPQASDSAGTPNKGPTIPTPGVGPVRTDLPMSGGSTGSGDPTTGGRRTLTSDAGSVVATCQPNGHARLITVDPAPGYAMKKVNYGPAVEVGVVFGGATAVRMKVSCVDGQPVASTGPE